MKEPWKKSGGWPYVAKNNTKTWQLGYRDHDNVVRSKSFKTKSKANTWIDDYIDAERGSVLRDFLLGSDAPEVQSDDLPLSDLILDWFAKDAHPDNEGGLAPETYDGYRSSASRHIFGNPSVKRMKGGEKVVTREAAPYAIGHLPAADFSTARAPQAWLKEMRAAGVGKEAEKKAWTVLSSALSWAIEDGSYPVTANGCRLMQRRRGMRRSSRRGGTGTAPTVLDTSDHDEDRSWALAPAAVERIRDHQLDRKAGREPIFPIRDAMVVAVQYQLACRNQEVWALRCGDLTKKRPRLRQVLTYGELDTGKTSGSTRPIRVPDLLLHDLEYYLSELSKAAFPTGPDDWLFPGNLSGRGHGHPAGHMTGSQAHKWGPRYFTKTADIAWSFSGDKLGDFSKATQYSLRRGGISLRLRAGEDRQVIADECGTSVQMIDQHYSHVLGLLRDEGPLSADEERLKARVAEFRVSHPEQVPA